MSEQDTNARRLAALEAENRALRADRDRWRAQAEMLDRLADQDPLTGLLNRRAFVRELGRTLAFARRYGTHGSLLYLDVDNLKQINDGQGHAAGDAALLRVADVLTNGTRASDVLGRLGGDEFAVLLQRAGEAEAARKVDDLRARLADAAAQRTDAPAVSLSIGRTTFDGHETAEAALTAADQAMYGERRRRRAEP
jgi:diguanylate cyclase (GGDEF)-like protein